MAIREGAWDCLHCGMKRNRGPEKFCGGCGAPRGDNVKFYLPEDARVVEDEEELRRAKAGPDWNCRYCGGDNQGYNNFCTGCGAGKDGSAPRKTTEYKIDEIPHSGEDLKKEEKEHVKGSKSDFKKEKKEPKRRKSGQKPGEGDPGRKTSGNYLFAKIAGTAGCVGLSAIVLILIVIGLFLAFRTHEVSLEVTGLNWERTIAIEEFRTITEEGWEGELPSDARYISESREIHHYEQVQVGTETETRTVTRQVQTGTESVKVGVKDMGNGYFEDVYEDRPVYEEVEETVTEEVPVYEDKPVYRQKITYEVDRWVPDRTEKASGTDRNRPVWPEFTLGNEEREGVRQENYTVTLVDSKGKSYKYKASSYQEWEKFEKGKSYKAKITGLGSLKSIEVK